MVTISLLESDGLHEAGFEDEGLLDCARLEQPMLPA
jgi:hypothetical protein